MRTAQQYKDLGIPSWYHDHARRYEAMFERAGWSDKQIDEAMRFGANFKGGTEEELIQQFRERGEYVNAPELDLVIDASMGLRDTIMSSGVESLPPLPKSETFTADHAARLAEIRQIARSDPQAFDTNRALQDEQLSLLEAQVAANGTVAPVQPKPTQAAAAPPATDRLAQIREMRRNDPHAWESNHALQAEELSLIEASLPPPASVADSAPSSQPSEGTSSE